jgi:hypothetical protein
MSNLVRRVRKLETRLTDFTGLVTHSQEWFAFWEERIGQIAAGEGPCFAGRIPLAVIDFIIEAAENELQAQASAGTN